MLFNPLDTFYKSQIGAVVANQKIIFRVKGNFDSVNFMCKKDGENFFVAHLMTKIDNYFQLEIDFNVGLYFYYFDCGQSKYIGKNINHIGQLMTDISLFQLTAYREDYIVPEWIYGGIIYQIFPDRFYSFNNQEKVSENKVLHKNWDEIPVFLPNSQGQVLNNDFFGGNIQGIINKLDYIKQLGINAIYLNPIFKAYSNHRYDTGDYMQIDNLLGNIDDLIELIKKCDKLGIKIILDGVFNHTGDDSIYFNKYGHYDSIGAYQSKNSPYYNWYNFKKFPDEYDSWWGIKTLPAINEDNDSYVDFITGKDGVLEFYSKLGIGGWRLDVVDELPTSFVKKIRKAIKGTNPNGIVIGEVWEDASNKISYGKRREYLQGDELDSAMNYPLKNAIINFVKYKDNDGLSKVIKEQIDHYPQKALHAMMNLLSTHDTARLLSVLDQNDLSNLDKIQLLQYKIKKEQLDDAILRLKMTSLLQFTLCGVPSIYYGDEIGMQGHFDPLNRCPFSWENINQDILDWYKFLGDLRNKYSAFSFGEYEEIYSKDGAFIFKRFDAHSEIMIAINVSDNDLLLEFERNLFEIYNNKSYCNEYLLKANSFAIFINKNNKEENNE